MNIQNLQAARTQLLYELGEVEYEKRLLIRRLHELDIEYDKKISALQSIESEIDETLNNAADKITLEKNND